MPIYEYQSADGCALCVDRFEVFAKLSDPELTHCPSCGAAVRRAISAPSVIGGQAHLLKEKNFAKQGFTQYRKADNGVYEKTAGNGPAFIRGDKGGS